MRRYVRKVSAWGGGGGGSSYEPLPLPQCDLPTASGSGNTPAELVREQSAATGTTTNSPKPVRTYAKFAATGAESVMWTRQVPSAYRSGGTFQINWKSATGTSGAVQWAVAFAPVVPGSTDDDVLRFNAVTVGSGTTVPGTQGQIIQTTLTPAASGMAAGRQYTALIRRHATGAADTSGSDAILTTAGWTYVA